MFLWPNFFYFYALVSQNTEMANGVDQKHSDVLFVLRFYSPVNPLGSCPAHSVYVIE